MIDRWSLVHFAFWFVAGANYEWHRVPLVWAALGTAVGVVLWEVAESWLERRRLVTGRESALNRWAGDPLASVAGAVAGYLWVM